MKEYKIDCNKREKAEIQMGCTFCENGIFSEMIMNITNYQEKTQPIENIEYKFYSGDISLLKNIVALVDADWVQYFSENILVFCGYAGQEPISFCIINVNADCILETSNERIGAIGCVGTVPQYRKQGIGLRMVDLATLYLKNEGCDLSSISYTHIDKWYRKLGYQTYARFAL